jgi:hypothetical protein
MSALNTSGGHQGRAAEQLGISRRTLTRKLKQYRDAEPNQVIGVLSKEQQEYFRADLDSECVVTCSSGMIAGRARNVSATGIALRELGSLPTTGDTVDLRFTLPDGSIVETRSRVAWAESDEAGLQFVGATPVPLAAWLSAQQAIEGWMPAGIAANRPLL